VVVLVVLVVGPRAVLVRLRVRVRVLVLVLVLVLTSGTGADVRTVTTRSCHKESNFAHRGCAATPQARGPHVAAFRRRRNQTLWLPGLGGRGGIRGKGCEKGGQCERRGSGQSAHLSLPLRGPAAAAAVAAAAEHAVAHAASSCSATASTRTASSRLAPRVASGIGLTRARQQVPR